MGSGGIVCRRGAQGSRADRSSRDLREYYHRYSLALSYCIRMSVLYESWHFNTNTSLQVLASKTLQDGWSVLVLGRQSLYATFATTPAIFLDHLFHTCRAVLHSLHWISYCGITYPPCMTLLCSLRIPLPLRIINNKIETKHHDNTNDTNVIIDTCNNTN